MNFEGLKNLLGMDKEDKGEKGRTAEGVTGDISTPQEKMSGEEERFAGIKEGIEAIMAEGPGFSYNDMLGRQDFFAEKLVERGVLTEKDLQFAGITEHIKKAAREVAAEGIENVGRDENWKKTA
ncbi:MAG: hypothetical protein AMXMBFR44_1580 [Candidatus Campbellbacteria bacterium]